MQIIGQKNGKKGEALMLNGGLALRPEELAEFAEIHNPEEITVFGTMILPYDLYSGDAFTQFHSAYDLVESWLLSDGIQGSIDWETDEAPEFVDDNEDSVDLVY